MGEVCTLVLFIHMVLQRPKRHLVAIVVKPTDLPTQDMKCLSTTSLIIILVRLSVCLFVCPDEYARVRLTWRFRFDTGAAWSGGQVEFA